MQNETLETAYRDGLMDRPNIYTSGSLCDRMWMAGQYARLMLKGKI
jgi:hypothetical protein